MRIPFFSILLEGDDISNYISSFKYEDSMDEDNMLELVVNPTYVTELDSNDSFVTGATIVFNWGFINNKSEFQIVKITDIIFRYDKSIRCTIKAFDAGQTMKKFSSNKVWKDVTTEDIVKTIAEKYGMSYVTDYSGRTWDSYPQSHMNDFEFLQQLAIREYEGNFIVYIRGNTLFFVKRNFDGESSVEFSYKKNLIRFEPKQRETLVEGINNSIAGKEINTVTTPKTNDTINLGKFKTVYDEFSNKLGIKTDLVDNIFDSLDEISKHIVVPHSSNTDVDNISKSVSNKNTMRINEATAYVTGEPNLKSNTVVEITNVLVRHEGNYLVKKITHTIDSGGYISTLLLSRNSTNINTGVESDSINKSEAPDSISDEVTLKVYDENGNLISDKKGKNYNEPN